MSENKVDRDTVLAIVAYLRTKVKHPEGKSCCNLCPFGMSGYEHHEAVGEEP
jgi:hypothetical protein